jgi:two-component system C4-dicarboxylate transport response regulator DctD
MAARILIVDHGTTVLDSIVEIVRDLGYDLQVCAAQTAAIVAAGYQPDVAVFDLTMPGPYTCDLLTTFRREQPHIPVVIIGLQVDARTVEHLLNKEAYDYISKPFTPDVLAAVIRAALRGETRPHREE